MLVTQVEVTENNPIVRIRPYQPTMQIEWMISKRCNFACSYCPPIWHDKTSPQLTLDQLKAAWEKIIKITAHKTDQKIHLTIIGGEPTLNKDLLPFLKWVNENYSNRIGEIGIVTNGSANSNLYIELVKYCNWITFSTHSEYMNEKKFFRNVVRAHKHSKHKKCMVMVNLMLESWYNNRINVYQEFLNKFGIANYKHQIHYGEGFNEFDGKRTEVRFHKNFKKDNRV